VGEAGEQDLELAESLDLAVARFELALVAAIMEGDQAADVGADGVGHHGRGGPDRTLASEAAGQRRVDLHVANPGGAGRLEEIVEPSIAPQHLVRPVPGRLLDREAGQEGGRFVHEADASLAIEHEESVVEALQHVDPVLGEEAGLCWFHGQVLTS